VAGKPRQVDSPSQSLSGISGRKDSLCKNKVNKQKCLESYLEESQRGSGTWQLRSQVLWKQTLGDPVPVLLRDFGQVT
jgi:hypothetical protein